MRLSMKITSIQFVISAAKKEQFPKDGLPQIAFVGRSNVGKSSLLNTLLNRKRLAYTSSTPGKTRLLNFFRINESFYFVDLPGYGYSKAPGTIKRTWRGLVESYFSQSMQLKTVVVLIDSRHDLFESDRDMIEWLVDNDIPYLIVATKADKLSKTKLAIQLQNILKTLAPLDVEKILPFSSHNGLGKMPLWIEITARLSM